MKTDLYARQKGRHKNGCAGNGSGPNQPSYPTTLISENPWCYLFQRSSWKPVQPRIIPGKKEKQIQSLTAAVADLLNFAALFWVTEYDSPQRLKTSGE